MSKSIIIYDPPMCCSSGVCGPNVDPELVKINETLHRLAQQFRRNVTINRVSLNRQPRMFLENEGVAQLMRTEGARVLPVTTVEGRIIKKGGYPTYEELVAAVSD